MHLFDSQHNYTNRKMCARTLICLWFSLVLSVFLDLFCAQNKRMKTIIPFSAILYVTFFETMAMTEYWCASFQCYVWMCAVSYNSPHTKSHPHFYLWLKYECYIKQTFATFFLCHMTFNTSIFSSFAFISSSSSIFVLG